MSFSRASGNVRPAPANAALCACADRRKRQHLPASYNQVIAAWKCSRCVCLHEVLQKYNCTQTTASPHVLQLLPVLLPISTGTDPGSRTMNPPDAREDPPQTPPPGNKQPTDPSDVSWGWIGGSRQVELTWTGRRARVLSHKLCLWPIWCFI